MTRLSKLHKRLAQLRRRRRRVRWGTGYSAMAIALLWVSAAAFLADWSFQLDRPLRIIAMALSAAVFLWAFRRYTRPWLGHRETELDLALLVQRDWHIDSDLVAAIQFESPEASEWGSVRLEQEVIDQTAEVGRRLDVMRGLSRRQLGWRMAAAAVTSVVLALGVWQFPDHARAFLNRFFLLGPQHYPTRTVIETIRINGRPVNVTGWRPQVVKSPYGEPVRFEVACSGRLPAAGQADLKTDRGLQTTVALSPAEQSPDLYAGELPRLVDAVKYQIYLGDAWTDPARLEVVPLPTIDVELEVTPPSYAAGGEVPSQTSTGLRQISVIEGSRVEVRLTSDKLLKTAALTVDGRQYEMRRDESRDPSTVAGAAAVGRGSPDPALGGSVRRPATTAGPATTAVDEWEVRTDDTPLARVVEPIRYEIRAVDVDDLEPERPIQGVIRIKADQGPRIVASAVTQFVLPTARPGISYDASDDYGLARLSILPRVTHEDGRVEELDEITIYELPELGPLQSEMQAQYALELARLSLTRGDQLAITLQALDYRGRGQEGKQALSEPLLFQVTDERGILAAMSETDRESANRLQTMIQRQIEVGEGQ